MKFIIISVIILTCFGTFGCEKLKYKMAQREVRQQYFKNYLDSSRKESYRRNDSIRKELLKKDSLANQ
jgi:hypothetical protein